MKRLFFATVGCIASISCAAQSTAIPEDDPELTFSWVECAQPLEPLFVMSVWRGGEVQYVGHSQVKTFEERIQQISAVQKRDLLSAGKQFIRRRHRFSQDQPDKQDQLPYNSRYCLSLRTAPSGTPTLANVQSNAARNFVDVADSVVQIRDKACPGRGPSLAGIGVCGFPSISFAYPEDQPCRVSHSVEIFPNGDVHYYSLIQRSADQFSRISGKEVRELTDWVQGFHVLGEESIAENAPPTSRTLRGSATELDAFRSRILAMSDLTWTTVSSESSECVKTSTDVAQREGSISLSGK